MERKPPHPTLLLRPLELLQWAFAAEPPSKSDPQRPSPELLLWAYGHGIFPMADPDSRTQTAKRIDWYSPDPRGILPLHPPTAFRIPKNLQREVRRARFEIKSDTAFEKVMRACGTDRSRDNRSWISEPLITAYVQLHTHGFARSVEAWLNNQLVGGLYGVHIGGAFFGESMFSRPDLGGTNSSKVCLVHLVSHLRRQGFTLLDTQFSNPHIEQFGCIEIDADDYLARLDQAIRTPIPWGELQP
jgi:leucyl/phenylalanyl-tRNA---protein transferase